MVLNKIRDFFKVAIRSERVELPQDVLDLMLDKKAYRLCPYMDWAGLQKSPAPIFEAIRTEVRRLEWPDLETKKFEAYVCHFSKSYQEAYKLSLPYIEGEGFDPDFFGIAIMALYFAKQYDLAYRLVKGVGANEVGLIGNLDYLTAAGLICWSAGDRYRTNKYHDLAMSTVKEAGVSTFNAFAIYFELGDTAGYERALAMLDETTVKHPNFQYSLAFTELAKNNYADGFRHVEARYSIAEAALYLREELLSRERWTPGVDIRGKRLLIHGEQGLGDMIQTARFFGQCCEVAEHVIVECPPESIALLQHNFPEITYVPLSPKPISEEYDIWVGTLSLPYVFGITESTVPGKGGYLSVPEDHAEYWCGRVSELADGRPKIGIAWSGYPGHRADRRRSIPWGMINRLIAQYPEASFFAVQTYIPEPSPGNLYGFSDELVTLSDTAALINEMDLVISVDSCPLHIAGAIGKEAWLMLPYRYEWRWGLQGEENPWYDFVKVIRQPSPGAWAPVLSHVFGPRLRDFLQNRISK